MEGADNAGLVTRP